MTCFAPTVVVTGPTHSACPLLFRRASDTPECKNILRSSQSFSPCITLETSWSSTILVNCRARGTRTGPCARLAKASAEHLLHSVTERAFLLPCLNSLCIFLWMLRLVTQFWQYPSYPDCAGFRLLSFVLHPLVLQYPYRGLSEGPDLPERAIKPLWKITIHQM